MAAGADDPRGAKVIAGASLLLWIGVMSFGRMTPWSAALFPWFLDPGT